MSKTLAYTLIEGIKCFSPSVCNAYDDYPDSGFDLTEKNVERSFWVRSRNRLFKALVYKNLLPNGKTSLLEIGCGTGNFIRQLVDNEQLQITGSEIYLKGLLYARKHLPNVTFIQYDVTEGAIDERFDLITAFDVIEHIEIDTAAIANINQMLNEQGTLIISVPQHQFLWSKLDEIVKHKRRYSRSDLLKKLTQGGFKPVYCTSFVFLLFPLMLISRLFDKRNEQTTDEEDFEKRVQFNNVSNWIFDCVMHLDEALIKAGFSLPFGGTLLVIAKKI